VIEYIKVVMMFHFEQGESAFRKMANSFYGGILNDCSLPKTCQVLDLACGVPASAPGFLTKCGNGNVVYVGLDLDDVELAEANRRFQLKSNLHFLHCDVSSAANIYTCLKTANLPTEGYNVILLRQPDLVNEHNIKTFQTLLTTVVDQVASANACILITNYTVDQMDLAIDCFCSAHPEYPRPQIFESKGQKMSLPGCSGYIDGYYTFFPFEGKNFQDVKTTGKAALTEMDAHFPIKGANWKYSSKAKTFYVTATESELDECRRLIEELQVPDAKISLGKRQDDQGYCLQVQIDNPSLLFANRQQIQTSSQDTLSFSPRL
jgi:hypothetical protein